MHKPFHNPSYRSKIAIVVVTIIIRMNEKINPFILKNIMIIIIFTLFSHSFKKHSQLNATLELERQQRTLYQQKCYNNPKINNQGRRLNENHLIEKQMRYLVPGHLIIFATLGKSNSASKSRIIIVKTNGIVRWKPSVENYVWNNLGK